MIVLDKPGTADRSPTIAEVFFSMPAKKRDEFYDISERLVVHEKGTTRKVNEFLSSLTDYRQWLVCAFLLDKIREGIRKASRKEKQNES